MDLNLFNKLQEIRINERHTIGLDGEAIAASNAAYNDKTRNLNFAGTYTNAETYIEQARKIRSYNEFNKEIAKRVVATFGENASYRLGREGSVVTYIKDCDTLPEGLLAHYNTSYDNDAEPTLMRQLMADELDKVEETGEIRIWWD